VIVVSDAGPIIHLSLVGRIDLLPSLYGQILIPDLVFKEVAQDGEGLTGSSELRNAEWAQLVSHDSQAFRGLCRELPRFPRALASPCRSPISRVIASCCS